MNGIKCLICGRLSLPQRQLDYQLASGDYLRSMHIVYCRGAKGRWAPPPFAAAPCRIPSTSPSIDQSWAPISLGKWLLRRLKAPGMTIPMKEAVRLYDEWRGGEGNPLATDPRIIRPIRLGKGLDKDTLRAKLLVPPIYSGTTRKYGRGVTKFITDRGRVYFSPGGMIKGSRFEGLDGIYPAKLFIDV